MDFKLKIKSTKDDGHRVIILDDSNLKSLKQYPEADWFNEEKFKNKGLLKVQKDGFYHFLVYANLKEKLEKYRRIGAEICSNSNQLGLNQLHFSADKNISKLLLPLLEGAALANYQFSKYKGKKFKNSNSLKSYSIDKNCLSNEELLNLQSVVEGTYWARDLVNEPLSYLNAVNFSKELKKKCKEVDIRFKMLAKTAIEKEKMGGLLAVNKGSIDPPTFNILEWKPKNAVNKKPIVLIGKGVVYDTGGLSLKPTPNSMDFMKSDMGGAAAVAAATYSIAKSKFNLWVITLIPSTDNRPGLNAYAPGDVIKMHNGMTVEVLNTDAEGRLLLADALSYAKRYNPEIVIDLATLTGAAARTIGKEGVVFMGNASENEKKSIQESGETVHERLVELPLWEEYNKTLESDIADIKNIGGPVAGAITAGMFLQYFTDFPWMHIDIAGMAFFDSPDAYRLKNGTGVGTRLLFDYLSKRTLA